MIDYNDDYSSSYREQLRNGILQARHFGFSRAPFISETTHVSDDTLGVVSKLTNEFSASLDRILPDYWGNSCQTLSSHLFAFFNSRGITADIVIGNVIINGTDEFETTVESLEAEIRAKEPLAEHQAVHAWVSLGDDTIIDAALPARLVKHYQAPQEFGDMIFIGRASFMSARYRLRYQPLLVGTEFFAKTNPPDPMDLLKRIRALSPM